MFCRKCGKKLPDDVVFCLYCGSPVVKDVQDTITDSKIKKTESYFPQKTTAIKSENNDSKKDKKIVRGFLMALIIILGAYLGITAATGAPFPWTRYPNIYVEDFQFPFDVYSGEYPEISMEVFCDVGVLNEVSFTIVDNTGNQVLYLLECPHTSRYTFQNSQIQKQLHAENLPDGYYHVDIWVTAEDRTKAMSRPVYSNQFRIISINMDSSDSSTYEEGKEATVSTQVAETTPKITKTEIEAPTITISDVGIPTHLEEGDGCSIFGKIETDKGNLTEVTVTVYDSSGKIVLSKSSAPNLPNYSLWNSQIDKNLAFGTLSAGTYTMEISAKAEYKKQKTETVLFSGEFAVKESENSRP